MHAPSLEQPTGREASRRMAVVTGATSRIGAATVRALGGAGFAIDFCARGEQPVVDLERDLRASGARVFGTMTDMSSQ